ncbi:MAG: MarR family winged helix-turn-helix transcriptional regulator [Vicinamibacterales bacterium]
MTSRRRVTASEPAAPVDLGCACASARRLARTLTQLYDRRLRDAGVEAPQFAILATLRQGPMSQTLVGRMHALDKATVSRNLRVLERQGWITTAVGDDSRTRQVALTPAGRTTLAKARAEWQDAQAELQSAMTSAQWRAMFETFRAVTAATQNLQRSARQRRQP